MSAQKKPRPAFQSIEIDPIDERLEAKAAEKGIPTLVTPKNHFPAAEELKEPPPPPLPPAPHQGTPRSRMKSSKIELPDYVWIALKRRAIDEMCSVRYLVLQSLRANGFIIKDSDMIEDGRRLR